MKTLISFFAFLIFSFKVYSQIGAKNIKDGKDVITAMYTAYAENKWYKYFTFSQETHSYKDGKEEKMEIWHEAGSFPGKLLIKFNTKDSKNGILFSDHKINVFTEGKEPVSKPMIHELLVAAFDIYFLKPEQTIHIFDSLGYDLKKVREDIFEGRKVYVVGAEKKDSTSKQFWIDAERLYLHRIIYARRNSVSDCVFSDYEKNGKYWVAKLVTFKTNGKLDVIEKYFDIKFPKKLNDDLFDPKKFNEVKLD
ncbi:MAG: hypothetical protein ABIP51_08240 [Bacteroidia bacterium]